MSFHDALFPTDYEFQAVGGPGFNTIIIENESGVEQRIQRFNSAIRKYRIRYKGKNINDVYALQEFFLARSGSEFSWKFKDWSDYTSAANGRDAHAFDDVQIGVGDGTEKDFQLVKKYTNSLTTRTRNITKPVLNQVKIGLAGVEQGSGWTVNTTTGKVTFSTAPSSLQAVTAGFEFYVHARFGKNTDGILEVSLDQHNRFSIPTIEIEEVKEGIQLNDEFPTRGAKYLSLTADTTITVNEGLFWDVVPDVAGHKLIFEDYTNIPTGAPHFFIRGNSPGFDIEDHLGNALVTSTVDGHVYLALLGLTSGGAKQWVVADG